jgi:prepilin-type N-terminal cleavage/methylation domain-containing protein
MKNGFTIIELIISIFILSIAIVGIFSAFSMITILTSDASNRLTATYLTQEGMEIVRNIRDTNWIKIRNGESGVTWDYGFSSCESGCEMDYTTGTVVSGAHEITNWSGDGNYLFKNNSTGFYTHNEANATSTKFKRKIIITPVEDVDGKSSHILKVTVQVSWDQKPTILNPLHLAKDCISSNCIIAEETLYDWFVY